MKNAKYLVSNAIEYFKVKTYNNTHESRILKKKIYKNNNNNHGIYIRHSEAVSQLKYEQCDI